MAESRHIHEEGLKLGQVRLIVQPSGLVRREATPSRLIMAALLIRAAGLGLKPKGTFISAIGRGPTIGIPKPPLSA